MAILPTMSAPSIIDHNTLPSLFRRHGFFARRVALRIVREHAEAEDVVQSAFLQLWSARVVIPARLERAWIRTVVRSRALDMRRSKRLQKKYLALYQSQLSDREAPPGGDPYRAIAASQQEAWVAAALAQLEPAQRRALQLFFFNGYSQAEMASLLAMPVGTVKTRIRAALKKLSGGVLQAKVPRGSYSSLY